MRRAEEDNALCAGDNVSISILLLERLHEGLDGVRSHKS